MVRQLDKGMGEAVAKRTILRPLETWEQVSRRVAFGNVLLHPASALGEYLALSLSIAEGANLMSGRHLQHGDYQQPERNMELLTNCSTSATSAVLFYLLLNGSGVGRSYDDDLMLVDWSYLPDTRVVLSRDHKDFKNLLGFESAEEAMLSYPDSIWFKVPDSREGWAQAVAKMETLAFQRVHRDRVLVLDFSDVRPEGSPINGMQSRPASGPAPLMQALKNVASVKYTGWRPWKQTMHVDHYLAECVLVGGARRAARIAVKHWKEPDILEFVNIKKQGGLWSANNSVGADEEFYQNNRKAKKIRDAIYRASYFDNTGEPGILNLHKLTVKNEGLELYEDGNFIESPKYSLSQDEKDLYAALAKAVLNHRYQYIVNPCGEIVLFLLGGYCVHGDTRILHRGGYHKIKYLVGTEIEVFNGEEWSKVTPYQTGKGQKLLRITLSDGSYLDCTDYHRFSVKRGRQTTSYQEVMAKDLWVGAYLPSFRAHSNLTGESEAEAYTYGAFLGDGYIEKRSICQDRFAITLYAGKHDLPVSGSRGSVQKNSGIDVHVSHLDLWKLRSLKEDELPGWVFSLDHESTLEFIKGWLDTDGCHHKDTGGVSVTTSKEDRARGLQLLLRRIGVSYASVKKVAEAGDETNFGERREDLWMVYVPSCEAGLLNAYRVKTDYPVDLSRTVKQQRVVAIEELEGEHDTFCFTEPKRGMGVFNNILTYQCVIGDFVPYHTRNFAHMENVLRLIVRALMRTNLMASLYHREVERTNRIGVGLTGIHEFAWKHFGLGFRQLLDEDGEGKPFWETLARLKRVVMDECESYAKELGVAAPHTNTTIKPAGTTSKLFGLTEGAHLPSMREYLRWVQFRNNDPLVVKYKDLGFPVRVLETYKGHTIVGFPTQPEICKLGMPDDMLVTAAEATPEEQFKWLQLLEKYWIRGVEEDGVTPLPEFGNQVSYTLKYDPSKVSFEEYSETLTKYLPTIRACSVMPQIDGTAYEYQPEESVSKERFLEIVQGIKDPEFQQQIDMYSLQCASGACPL